MSSRLLVHFTALTVFRNLDPRIATTQSSGGLAAAVFFPFLPKPFPLLFALPFEVPVPAIPDAIPPRLPDDVTAFRRGLMIAQRASIELASGKSTSDELVSPSLTSFGAMKIGQSQSRIRDEGKLAFHSIRRPPHLLKAVFRVLCEGRPGSHHSFHQLLLLLGVRVVNCHVEHIAEVGLLILGAAESHANLRPMPCAESLVIELLIRPVGVISGAY